jgi:hypothetical protein
MEKRRLKSLLVLVIWMSRFGLWDIMVSIQRHA